MYRKLSLEYHKQPLQTKEIYVEEAYKPFPQEPLKQLEEAIEAVFKSWDNDRARVYRDLYLRLYQYHVEYHLNLYIHVHDHYPKI
jgi:hypothetical protein